MVNVDLLDAQDSARALSSLSGITHVFYSAWSMPRTGQRWLNRTSLCCAIWSVTSKHGPLETVSLMQGYKVYGASWPVQNPGT